MVLLVLRGQMLDSMSCFWKLEKKITIIQINLALLIEKQANFWLEIHTGEISGAVIQSQ
jgi:hypothetical protein